MEESLAMSLLPKIHWIISVLGKEKSFRINIRARAAYRDFSHEGEFV